MHVVRFELRSVAQPSEGRAALIADLIRACAGPGGGVEHVTVTALRSSFDVTLFLSGRISDPGEHGAAVIAAARDASELFAGWRARTSFVHGIGWNLPPHE